MSTVNVYALLRTYITTRQRRRFCFIKCTRLHVKPWKRQRHGTWYSAAYRCAVALLQPWKWQLTGISYSTAAQASGAHCPRNGLWTCNYAARRTTPQSATLGLHPVIHVPNYMDHYSFTDPWGMNGWVGHVGWPRADGLTTECHPFS